MAIVFKTPKSALNTTTKTIQNLANDCPPCPEPVLEKAELEYTQNGEYTVTPEEGVDGFSEIDVTVNVPSDVNNQDKTVSPSTSSQSVSADSGYSGLGTVTVNAVTSSIDNNIAAGNIKKDVTILGVTGNYDPQPNLTNITVTPSTSAQEYNPAISGVDGYSLVRVNAVTASIDSNIQSENILEGVTILGVNGSNAGYDAGYSAGVGDGEATGYQNGYDAGYGEGYSAGQSECPDPPILNPLSVTPSTSAQTIYPESGVEDGFSDVSVAAVTAAIDQNIVAGNIKSGVTILGVSGSVVEANLQQKSANATNIGAFTVTPDSGYNGLSRVSFTVSTNPMGSFGNPYTGAENMYDTPNLEEAYVEMEVASSSFVEDQSGNYYTVEDENGNIIDKLYTSNVLSNIDFPFDFTGKTIRVFSDSFEINVDDSDPQDVVYTYELNEADLQSIDGNINDELWWTPDYENHIETVGRNQIGGININVMQEPQGTAWVPFDVWSWSAYVDAKIPETTAVNFILEEVTSGSIDNQTGYYVAEDQYGNTLNIRPFAENPDYDPELDPEEQPGIPELIFPQDFDLVGRSIVVTYEQQYATITEDPNWDEQTQGEEERYTIEVSEGDLVFIDWNSNWDTWLLRNINASTRSLSLNTNEPQQMSISSSEPWEIEIGQPNRNLRSLSKSGAKSPAPTLEIDQMEGDAGVFTLNVLSTTDQNTGFTVRGLNSGNEVYVEVNSSGNYFTIESLEDNNVVTFYAYTDNIDLHFRVNDDEWDDVELEQGTSPFNNMYVSSWTLDTGDILQFYGDNDTLALDEMYHQQYCHFGSTKTVDVSGCIASLLDSVNFVNYQLNSKYSFCGLFAKTTYDNQDIVLKIENASDLIMASPYEYSYMQMFQENAYIETPPELPFKQAYKHCYDKMFYSCTSLLSAPELPSVLAPEYCYYEMFSICTSLTSVPTILPAKKVEESAYSGMFFSCSNITAAPELPAKTLSNACYSNMFNGCNNLSSAPALPATTLAANCYKSMFRDCRSLTTAPELPATTLARYCYEDMFDSCTNLATAPVLPATTLENSCYANMFYQCWALTTAPDLPATTLTDSCYREMFRRSGVTSVVCLATTNVTTSNVTAWLADTTTGVGTLYKDPNMTGWVVGTNVPSGWTIADYNPNVGNPEEPGGEIEI